MSTNAGKFVVIITTCGTAEEASRIATGLVDARLAACVQARTIQSTYWWERKLEQSDEVQLLIKARSSDYAEIESWIKAMHSYRNPEVIAVPVVEGSQAYLDWIEQETQRGQQ